MSVEGGPRSGQRSPIYDNNGHVIGGGKWVEQQYETPEGTKSFMTVVPDERTAARIEAERAAAEAAKGNTANAQTPGHALPDVDYGENDWWNR